MSAAQCEVYTFGQNSYGELGHGDVTERTLPTLVRDCSGKAVRQVVAGNEHTVMLMEDGEVLACGYNDSGQCGTGDTERVPHLRRLEAFEGKKVVSLHSANGCEHLVTITAEGEVFTNGYNARSQLGHGCADEPMHAEVDSADAQHQQEEQQQRSSALSGGAAPEVVCTPKRVRALTGRHVVRVACSYYHTLIATEEDEVFAFGRNDYGQCGLGHSAEGQEIVSRPAEVVFFQRRKTLALACGQYHSAVSLAAGGVCTFGKNDYGQLALGKPRSGSATMSDGGPEVRRWPTEVAAPLRGTVVTQLSAGYYHNAALSADGQLFTWGRNDYGQVGKPPGQEDRAKQWLPALVHPLERCRVLQVACGCYHTLVLTEASSSSHAGVSGGSDLEVDRAGAGNASANRTGGAGGGADGASGVFSEPRCPIEASCVWAFGRNNHGQLGNGSTVDAHTPVRLKSLDGKGVGQVVAGFYHSICCTGLSLLREFARPSTSLSADLTAMLDREERADLRLICGCTQTNAAGIAVTDGEGGLDEGIDCSGDRRHCIERVLHVHWCMIAARCEVFEAELEALERAQKQPGAAAGVGGGAATACGSSDDDGDAMTTIRVPYRYEVARALVEFLYTDQVSAISRRRQCLDFELALDLLQAAEKLKLDTLQRICEHAIKNAINPSNVSRVLSMAHTRGARMLFKKCFDFCVYHFGQVMRVDSFSQLPQPLLHSILVAASTRWFKKSGNRDWPARR